MKCTKGKQRMNTRALSRLLPLSRSISLSPVRSFSIKRRRLMTAPPPPGKFPAYYTRNHKPARALAQPIIHARNASRSKLRRHRRSGPAHHKNKVQYNRIPEYKVKPMELMSKWREGWRKLDLGVKTIRVSCEQGSSPNPTHPNTNSRDSFPARRASHIITIRRRRGRFSDE